MDSIERDPLTSMSEGREKPRKDFHFRLPQDKRVFRQAGEEGRRRRRRRNKYFHPHSLFVAQHLFRSSFSNVRKSLQNRINPSSFPVATPPPWQCVFSGRRMEPLSNRIMLHRINFVTLALLRGELIYSKTFGLKHIRYDLWCRDQLIHSLLLL